MLSLSWIKCQNDQWCGLESVTLESIGDVSGVYLIWHGGQTSRWVRVGQGNIKDRLSAHRKDPEILAYRSHGLYVTWANVHASQQDGVEAYLASACSPLVGERFPGRTPIEVNLPK